MRCVLVQHTRDFRTKTYGKNKKGKCDLLSHNSDFFFTSGNCEFISHNSEEKKVRIVR